ncbi:MAG: hypothetical protein WC071_00405 [Victivallaceae bacterium]
MQKTFFTGALCLVLTLVVGCLSFNYKGETFPQTSGIKIYDDATKIPAEYSVMGRCVCSGKYEQFSKEEMYRKIVAEAEDKGADAVLVYAYQVVPAGRDESGLLREDSVSVWVEGSDEVSGWNQLTKDFDGGYNTIGKKNSAANPLSYTRIVRAELLKFNTNLSAETKEALQKKHEADIAATNARIAAKNKARQDKAANKVVEEKTVAAAPAKTPAETSKPTEPAK